MTAVIFWKTSVSKASKPPAGARISKGPVRPVKFKFIMFMKYSYKAGLDETLYFLGTTHFIQKYSLKQRKSDLAKVKQYSNTFERGCSAFFAAQLFRLWVFRRIRFQVGAFSSHQFLWSAEIQFIMGKNKHISCIAG